MGHYPSQPTTTPHCISETTGEADKVAAMTREINGTNDARKAGAIGEMWHWLKRLEKRHKASIRRVVRLRGPDGHLIEGGPEAHRVHGQAFPG